jgi:hypothetical protein
VRHLRLDALSTQPVRTLIGRLVFVALLDALLPVLYLRGISAGDFQEALTCCVYE